MNEIKLITVGGVDQNVKDQYARDIIAPSENGLDSSTNLPVSSRHYDEGAYLIGQDRKYYEAIQEIDIGDELIVGTNIRETTVTEEILMLKGQSANVAIECMADMETAATASKAFATGKYVYWNYGVDYGMYEVIADIAQGDAFTTSGASQNIRLSNKLGDDISELKVAVTKYTNPNLIDNPWFTVNQRGFSNRTTAGFTVDRWKYITAAGTISLSSGVLSINPTVIGTTLLFGQGCEKDLYTSLLGKTVTLSVMLGDGSVKSVTFTIPANSAGQSARQIARLDLGSTHRFELYKNTDDYFRVGYYNENNTQLPSSPLTIKAVKLELGSISTLANDCAPNYATELAKCQRYFTRYYSYGDWTNFASGYEFTYAAGKRIIATLYTPSNMRLNPSCTFSGNVIAYHPATATYKSITSINVDRRSGNSLKINAVHDEFSGTTIVSGEVMDIVLQNGAYIDLSADL